ncbi:hypothetical protein B0T10DRAFT_404285 [Thelonectria olida]|uniref:F-box domain-containing protein n=1 Tax=Thelonectria olida TaxID=1576542 RepID=A0A9P8W569_9HYPO|nr:hypothetical protein B0T10DRAFT_404285 [Thelonectria olida]
MAFQNVPEELLDAIISRLSGHDLLTARLVCHRWKVLASKDLFHTISLVPTDKGFDKWYHCVNDEGPRSLARRLVIYTTIGEGNSLAQYYDAWYDVKKSRDRREEDPERLDPISSFADFPQVDQLCLVFSSVCLGELTDDFTAWHIELMEARKSLLEDVFEAIKTRYERPNTSKIRHLTIQNLQNVPLPEFTSSELFRSVTEHLEQLDLQVIVEHNEDDPDSDIHWLERRTFEPYMHEAWLAPLSDQLTSLSLSFDEHWGTMPGTFTGHGLVFPHLKTLKLGRYSISHYDHLDWVLAQPSLRTLIFEHCRVVSHVWERVEVIEIWEVATRDWFRLSPDIFDGFHKDAPYHFPGTWEFMFDKIRLGLPHLIDFQFQIAWSGRYVAYQGETMPTRWIWGRENGDKEFGDGIGFETERKMLNRAKETDEGDSRALEELREATRRRS